MYWKFVEKFAKFKNYIKWLYSLYELNTQISICEPWEKVFCNVLIATCLSLVMYASYAYIPGYCRMLVRFLMPISGSANYTTNNKIISCVEDDDLCSGTESYFT